MKLRIRGDSLRIRLSHAEVRHLCAGGAVEERTQLTPERALTFRVGVAAQLERVTAHFSGELLEVLLPRNRAHEWCTTDLVSIAETQPNGREGLRLTVEKDFDSAD